MLQKPSRDLDTLIVLGAQVNGTKLSNSLKLRLERAKEYLDENPETIAVVSGGKGSGEEISEAEAMYEYLVSQGIDETRLIKEDRSTNTNENLKYSLALLEEKSNKKPRRSTNWDRNQRLSRISGNFDWKKRWDADR